MLRCSIQQYSSSNALLDYYRVSWWNLCVVSCCLPLDLGGTLHFLQRWILFWLRGDSIPSKLDPKSSSNKPPALYDFTISIFLFGFRTKFVYFHHYLNSNSPELIKTNDLYTTSLDYVQNCLLRPQRESKIVLYVKDGMKRSQHGGRGFKWVIWQPPISEINYLFNYQVV